MALGSLLEQAGLDDSLIKKALKEQYHVVEDIPFLKPNSWMRSSKFPTVCPREEVICTRIKKKREWKISTDLKLIFDHGHALHARLQDHILPDIGVLRGKWICNGCGTMQGGPVPDDDSPVSSWAIARPDECESCGVLGTDFRFHEVKFYNDEHRISGHNDGFLEIDPLPGLGVLEGKSIKPGWQIQNTPKLEHAIQLQTYLWLTDLQWGIILYWIKGENGLGALVEHFVERDEETIDGIKATLKSIWTGVNGGAYPDRICPDNKCPRAKACPVVKECFSSETDEF
jgi:hypothetical protein